MKRGSIGIGFTIFLMVFFITTFLIVEIYNMYAIKDSAQTLLTRATNVAIEKSYRRDLLQASGAYVQDDGSEKSKAVVGIDTKIAKQAFYEYLTEAGIEFNDMGTEGLIKNADGKVNWILDINNIEMDDGLKYKSDGTLDFVKSATTAGPFITVKATIKRNPMFMLVFLENCDPTKVYTIEIPLTVKTRSRKE